MKYVISLGCTLMLMVGILAAQDENPGFRITRGKIETPGVTNVKVKDSTESNNYLVMDGTKYNWEGKTKLADFKEGEEITLIYQVKGEKYYIREINNSPMVYGKIESISVKVGEDGILKVEDSKGKTWAFRTNNKTLFSRADNLSTLGKMEGNCWISYNRTDNETYPFLATFVECKRK